MDTGQELVSADVGVSFTQVPFNYLEYQHFVKVRYSLRCLWVAFRIGWPLAHTAPADQFHLSILIVTILRLRIQ